ncbi:Threonine/homoserine exporter RhtA [Austwickia sp. TVS 96-490-7B]|nr:Threonine/homoserine exporter RhtA [Austwickia sp. TVS 96-490-7B]
MTPSRETSGYPVALVLISILSVQFGGALASLLIPRAGVWGSVALRLSIAGLIMLVISRPKLAGHGWGDAATVMGFGLSLAVMNTAFYASLAHLPIGVAVTVEFIGPLTLSAALSRRWADRLAVLAAASGVVMISGIFDTSWERVEYTGLALALLAGAAWAAYIIMSARAGQRFPGTQGLTWAMLIATAAVLPHALYVDARMMWDQEVICYGVGIALLSSVLPYSLELVALRTLDTRIFGILLCLEPAVAALAGFLMLHETLTAMQLVGMSVVVGAAAVVTKRSSTPTG